jgi:hypothetical protein
MLRLALDRLTTLALDARRARSQIHVLRCLQRRAWDRERGDLFTMTTSNESDFVEPAPPGEFSIETSDYEFAVYLVLGDINVEAQLSAISHLLQKQKDAEQLLAEQIREADEVARKTRGIVNEQAIEDYFTRVHNSVYQDAAHSMAAVGMLAPLIESIFCQSFDGLRRNFLEPNKVPFSPHPRWHWSGAAQWDCHFVWGAKGLTKDLVAGIMQLVEAVGLFPRLPASRPDAQVASGIRVSK